MRPINKISVWITSKKQLSPRTMSNKCPHINTASTDAGDTWPRLWTIGMWASTNRRCEFSPAKEEPERKGQWNSINLRNVWNSKLNRQRWGWTRRGTKRGNRWIWTRGGEETEKGGKGRRGQRWRVEAFNASLEEACNYSHVYGNIDFMLRRDAANINALDSLSERQGWVRVLSGRAASEKRKAGLNFVPPGHCRQSRVSFAFLSCFSLVHYM